MIHACEDRASDSRANAYDAPPLRLSNARRMLAPAADIWTPRSGLARHTAVRPDAEDA